MSKLTIVITGISQPLGIRGVPRELPSISVQVTGNGVTIEAGDIMIPEEGGDRIVTAINQWKAAQGILGEPAECKEASAQTYLEEVSEVIYQNSQKR